MSETAEVTEFSGRRETVAAPEPGVPMSHRQIMLVFSGLMLGMFLAALDQTIVGVALPTIVNSLHGLNHMSWVVTAYLLTSTISTPLYGKIGDQVGRKGLFQFAIVIFLAGSALSGLSQNMTELIVFRGIQGIGGGGLMALAFAIIADVVSPKERGRYQGYFGAVFAVSSVAGPLLGGVFTESLSWRWIFYINLPLGVVALMVTSTSLRLPFRKVPHRTDYVGALLMAVGVAAVLLVTVWGGTQYAWSSATILSLSAVAVVFLVAFGLWERKATEPLLPPSLFHIGVVRVSSAVSFLLSMSMFGAVVFLPLYLQLVHGVSPTVSGLLMVPLMVGVLLASIISGRVVSQTGRYKVFPIVGSALTVVGMLLFTTLGLHTSNLVSGIYFVVLGAGVGLTMQIMVLATQNAVPVTEIGTATSAVTFFRSLGGAFGTSLFGAVFIAGLTRWIPRLMPAAYARHFDPKGGFSVPQSVVRALPAAARNGLLQSFVNSLHLLFLVGVPIAAVTFGLTFLLKENMLRTTSGLDQQAKDDAAAVSGGAAHADGDATGAGEPALLMDADVAAPDATLGAAPA